MLKVPPVIEVIADYEFQVMAAAKEVLLQCVEPTLTTPGMHLILLHADIITSINNVC